MNRLLATTACALAGCGDPSGAGDPGGRWNVVLVSLDTCRADRIGAYGAARPTPHLDRLAAESVRFEDCLAQSGSTAPSHMSMLTGHYVHRHGLTSNGLVSRPPYTLASILREQGWRTAAFTGHGSFQEIYGFGEGFDVFEGGDDVPWPFTRDLAETIPEGLAWLDASGREPFFLLVHGYDPHIPYWPPEPWRSELAGWYTGDLEPGKTLSVPRGLEPMEQRYLADLYDGEVAAADHAIGALLDELRERGLLERTVFVFTSDHGESLGPEKYGHIALTEEILRVPLMIRFPGGRWSGAVPEGIQHVDLVPTVLSALGVDPPGGLQGIDLMPRIRSAEPLPAERMRLAQRDSWFAVDFGERWRAVFRIRAEGGRVEARKLYDRSSERPEAENLVEDPDGERRFQEMVERYLTWREATADADGLFAAERESPVGTVYDAERKKLEALGYGGEE